MGTVCSPTGARGCSALADLAGSALRRLPERSPAAKPPTAAEAKAFVDEAEKTLLQLWITQSRADWVKSTYITDDTEILAAQAADRTIAASVQYAKDATRFDRSTLPAGDGAQAQAPQALADARGAVGSRPSARS